MHIIGRLSITALLLLSILRVGAQASEKKALTLHDAILVALQKNQDLIAAKLESGVVAEQHPEDGRGTGKSRDDLRRGHPRQQEEL